MGEDAYVTFCGLADEFGLVETLRMLRSLSVPEGVVAACEGRFWEDQAMAVANPVRPFVRL